MKWDISAYDATDGFCDQCKRPLVPGKTASQWSHYDPAAGGMLYTFCLKCVAQYGDMLKVGR